MHDDSPDTQLPVLDDAPVLHVDMPDDELGEDVAESRSSRAVPALSALAWAVMLLVVGVVVGMLAAMTLQFSSSRPLMVQTQEGSAGGALPAGQALDARGVYDRVSPGVVTLRASLPGGEGDNLGTGSVIDKRGFIVTNLHVVSNVEGSSRTIADKVYVEFLDGSRAVARVVGQDPNADLALLQIRDVSELDLQPVVIGDSEAVRVGDPVMTIGSPFGRPGSMSVGVVSGRDRVISSLVGSYGVQGALQTDAAVNRGNSGGPLLDAKGRLIGINSQIDTQTQLNEGVAYAIPSAIVKQMLPRLRQGGTVQYAYLGVTSRSVTEQLARVLDLPVDSGALIQGVAEGSPAAKGGLSGPVAAQDFYGEQVAVGGDIVVAVDDQRVDTAEQLTAAITAKLPGDEVKIKVVKADGTRETRSIVLQPRT